MTELPIPARIDVVDSHTEGEPTRVVVGGWPAAAGADMAALRADVAARHDHLRAAVIGEPRGHAALVGALLTEPVTAGAAAGVVFFNNVGYLGMCGHGAMGVVRTLRHLGRIGPGHVLLDTPAGTVAAELGDGDDVVIRNVAASCHALDVVVDVPGAGRLSGDIAYGGNWFFITRVPSLQLAMANLEALLDVTAAIRTALERAGITGGGGAEIDHIELTAPLEGAVKGARNFVLCPGGEYDRSPCGTGTSAKMAALHARGDLRPGETWRQVSVTGGVFDGWLEETTDGLVPCVRGRDFITGEATLFYDPRDPFRLGVA
ncbi:MAG TPA: proline racemase family protein [Longimicrobiales bacterium]|nr:proline racemase family protein [Longimicrobiales bacterium]